MKDKAIHSFLTLPVELVYRILDKLDTFTILCSMLNVCTRINVIVDDYRQHPTLIKLDLRYNQIGRAGARYLAHGLQYNTTLTMLSLEQNSIDFQAGQYFEIEMKKVPLRVWL
ncbi:unnamed protein product [Rotaria sordida]|uniref:F-box domain-containing protein n=1 Tax=Rotaria sordida TaxID=392033 RepID=A0A814ZX63_9BILA|nr:unnamed protein product [Rotaria sordida]